MDGLIDWLICKNCEYIIDDLKRKKFVEAEWSLYTLYLNFKNTYFCFLL